MGAELLIHADDPGGFGQGRETSKRDKQSLETDGLKCNVAKAQYMVSNSPDTTSVRICSNKDERTDQVR